MPTDALPNDVMSNFCTLAVVPLATALALRIKSGLCDTFRRGPRQIAVDRFIIIANNLLAFSLFVLWATCLPGSAVAHLERLIVVDVLIVVHVQHYILVALFRYARDRYHEPGELALRYRKRRVKVSMLVTTLSCSGCAALSAVTERYYPSAAGMVSSAHDAEYWFVVAALPCIHAALRTVVLDMQGCKRAEDTIEEQQIEVIQTTTNSFTITDEEEEEEEHNAPES